MIVKAVSKIVTPSPRKPPILPNSAFKNALDKAEKEAREGKNKYERK